MRTNILNKIWKDSVCSQVIASFIVTILSGVINIIKSPTGIYKYVLYAIFVFFAILFIISLFNFLRTITFNASYRKTDWKRLFQSANKEITICAYYLDSFLSWTQMDIINYLKKDKTKLVIITVDTTDEQILNRVQYLFPDYSKERIKNKINDTARKLKKLCTDNDISTNKIHFYRYPNLLNYNFILIDESKIFFSFYEMERVIKKDAFSLIINLNKEEETKQFFKKEIEKILEKSTSYS